MECPRAFLGKLVPEHFFFSVTLSPPCATPVAALRPQAARIPILTTWYEPMRLISSTGALVDGYVGKFGALLGDLEAMADSVGNFSLDTERVAADLAQRYAGNANDVADDDADPRGNGSPCDVETCVQVARAPAVPRSTPAPRLPAAAKRHPRQQRPRPSFACPCLASPPLARLPPPPPRPPLRVKRLRVAQQSWHADGPVLRVRCHTTAARR